MPAGTRTAPTVDGLSATSALTTLFVIDASGDTYSEAIKTTSTPADADIEAWVAAYQATTQASVYKVAVQTVYEGDADPDNAELGQRNSVKDGVNLLYKDIANLRTTSPRLVAPESAVMQGNQDIPLLSAGVMVTLINTTKTLVGAGYELTSAQFTERRERSNNPRIKA